jgi:hypothetical protein
LKEISSATYCSSAVRELLVAMEKLVQKQLKPFVHVFQSSFKTVEGNAAIP